MATHATRARGVGGRLLVALLVCLPLLVAADDAPLAEEAVAPPPRSMMGAQQRQDWRTAQRVWMRLSQSRALEGADIRVGARLGEVTLTGSVARPELRQRAVQIARRTRGVRAVEDALVVASVAAEAPELTPTPEADAKLAGRVARMLAREVFPDARTREEWRYGWRIDADTWALFVSADRGYVTFDGSTDSVARLADAVARTRKLDGVRGVAAYATAADEEEAP